MRRQILLKSESDKYKLTLAYTRHYGLGGAIIQHYYEIEFYTREVQGEYKTMWILHSNIQANDITKAIQMYGELLDDIYIALRSVPDGKADE
jgi:hypothetical protein